MMKTPRFAGEPRSERGMALIGVILLLMTMSALGAALAISGNTETYIARNQQTAAEARAAAEAGVNHAVDVTIDQLEDWPGNFATASDAVSDLLLGPDGASGTSQTDADNGSLADLGIPLSQQTLNNLPNISYEVRLFDEDDPNRGVTLSSAEIISIGENSLAASDANSRLVVRAIGRASGNAVSTLEATIGPVILPAVVTNEDLELSGNVTIAGTEGGVHSNADLDISGNAIVVAEDATASGTYEDSGTPVIGGDAGGGYPTKRVPSVDATEYLWRADFILTDTGIMTDQAGTVICDASADEDACRDLGYGWRYEGANGWRVRPGTQTMTAATYYVEGDARISGNLGSAVAPQQISVIAEGSIQVEATQHLRPDTPALLFVTNEDLEMDGNVTAITEEAQMLAHEQISLDGTVELSGQVLAEDAAAVSDLVTSNEIDGTVIVIYNGIVGRNIFTVTAWRSVQ